MNLPIFVEIFTKRDVWDVIPSCPTAVRPCKRRARCAPGDAGQRRAALLRNEAAPVGPAVPAQAGHRRGYASTAAREGGEEFHPALILEAHFLFEVLSTTTFHCQNSMKINN